MLKVMMKLGILFILSISCKSDFRFKNITACSMIDTTVKCAEYDLNIQKYVSPWMEYPASKVQYAFIIPEDEFLLKLKPDLYELGLIREKAKKRLNIDRYQQGFDKVKSIYEFH